MNIEFLIKFFNVLVGVVAGSLIPWMRKLNQGEIHRFECRCLISAAASFIICFIITLLIFPQFKVPSSLEISSDPTLSFEPYFKIFCLAFGFGFGFDAFIKEASEWVRLYRYRLKVARHDE